MPKKISQEILDEACNFYISNSISASEVGKLYGFSEKPILEKIKKLGLSKNRRQAQVKLIKIPEEEYDKIIHLYLKYKNYNKIASIYKVSKKVIRKILLSCNITILNSCEKRKISKTDEQKIINRYTLGESSTDIAKDYGISGGAILYYLKKSGIKIEKRTSISCLSEQEKADIINMYKNGVLVKDIIKKYKINNNILRKFLINLGLDVRSRGEIYLLDSNKKITKGISGYYMGKHFRSLNELCFIGKVLMKKYSDSEWRSAETKQDRIRYTDNENKSRWYYPDFIVRNKIVIECKPAGLIDKGNNPFKFKAARLKCKENKMKFIIIDFKLDLSFMKKEYENGNLSFTEKEKIRFGKKINKLLLQKA